MITSGQSMFKRLISVFLFSFFSFLLYAQEITITDITIVAENVNVWENNRGRYHEIVDKDIQELMDNENVQYIDTLFDPPKLSSWKYEKLIGLFSIENMFYENIPNMEEHVIYRMKFNKDNTIFVVYTASSEPFSLISYFRIFVRKEGSAKNFIKGLSKNTTARSVFLMVIIGGIVAGSLIVFMIKRKHHRSNSSTSRYSQ